MPICHHEDARCQRPLHFIVDNPGYRCAAADVHCLPRVSRYGRQLSQISLSSILSEYDGTGSEDEGSDSGLELVAKPAQVAPLKRERTAQRALLAGLEEPEHQREVWAEDRAEQDGQKDGLEEEDEKKEAVEIEEAIDEKVNGISVSYYLIEGPLS